MDEAAYIAGVITGIVAVYFVSVLAIVCMVVLARRRAERQALPDSEPRVLREAEEVAVRAEREQWRNP
jgi:hypothetical protein